MSLRINLLPEYVRLQRVFKRFLVGAVALLAAAVTVLFLIYYQRQQYLATLLVDRNNIEPVAAAAEAAQAAADAARNESRPKRAAIEFMVAAGRSGPQRAAMLDLVGNYIYGGTVVTSLDISDGQNVKIRSTVRNPDEYARFLTNLRRGSDANGGPLFTGLPVSSGVPGFPPPRPGEAGANQDQPDGQPAGPIAASQPTIIVLPVTVDTTAVLKNPVLLPPDPTAAAGGDQAAEGDPEMPGLVDAPEPE